MALEIEIVVPATVQFADLELSRSRDGRVSIAWDPVARICETSRLDDAVLMHGPPVLLPLVLTGWLNLLLDQGVVLDGVDEFRVLLDEMMTQAAESMADSGAHAQFSLSVQCAGTPTAAPPTLH